MTITGEELREEKILGKEEEFKEIKEKKALAPKSIWTGTGPGTITFLRVNDIGHVWGAPPDALYTEVVVQHSTLPDFAFGFYLRPDDKNLSANLAMLSTIRDAMVHKISIAIAFTRELKPDGTYTQNCIMRRVNLYP